MKKLIVLATLAALPAAAMADVVISGDIGVTVRNVKDKDDGQKNSANQMDRQTGQIVFSAKEDLGNGLKAIWQVANRIDVSGNETNNWHGRDTFIGLEGDFGKVRLGKLSNPINSGYGSVSPFYELDMNGDGVYLVGEERLANSVRYDSPSIAGFSAAASVQLKPEASGDNTQNDHAAPYGVGFGLKYENGPILVSYGRTEMKDQLGANLNGSFELEANADGDFEAVNVQGGKTTSNMFNVVYSADNLTAGFGYGDAKYSDQDTNAKQRGYGVFASYAMGNITPAVSFWKEGKAKIDGDTVLGSYNVVSVGVDYALSKRTSAGVELQFQSGRKNEATDEKTGKKQISAVYLTTKF